MSNNNYDSSSVIDLDFPGFDEYDIVTGNDFQDFNEKTSQVREVVGTRDDIAQAASPSDVYREELEQLFCNDINIDELKKKSLAGELRSSHFRSICWRCLLGILHSEPKQWLLELTTYRTHYGDLWIELQKNPWNVERSPSDNPLSQEEESIWQKYFSNEELKSVIHQDVIRTFPGVAFFRKKTIQDLMVRILFCYARQNPSLCYRQGMHEILAPLIYVLHCDCSSISKALLYFKDQNSVNADIFEILNPKFIEEDAYSIFKHIMNHIECSYRIKNVVPTSTGYFKPQIDDEKNCENEVISRLQYIKDNILLTSDPDLNKHLDELDIPLQLFGIRWLRLLFGREFPFQDLLVVWDAIFAISSFELVNYIVVAMLTAIRRILLAGDYMTCLTNLMRYPSGVDVMFVVEYALYLMNPAEYAAPTVTSSVNKPVSLIPKAKSKIKTNQNFEDYGTHSAHAERLKILKQSKWLVAKHHPLALAGSGDADGSIVEGFALDDPKVLQSDLEVMTTTMGVVYTKLTQYHSILSRNLTEPLSADMRQALEGINELCSLLKTHRCQTAYSNVEPAFEADEMKQSTKKKTDVKKPSRSVDNVDETKANTLPKAVIKVLDGELQVFKQCQGGPITGAPMTDPLQSMRRRSGDDVHDIRSEP